MEIVELLEIINRGEDSSHQFKRSVDSPNALAAEMAAFSNSRGGLLIIGVDDDGTIIGLSPSEIAATNNRISNAASQGVNPAISTWSDNITIGDKTIIVVDIPQGLRKPCLDKDGIVWVKNGADKRKVTSRDELLRLYQASDLAHADESPVPGANISDLDLEYFADYFRLDKGESLDDQDLALPEILHNMGLMSNGSLNLSCVLLFGKNPQVKLPAFFVTAAAYPSNDLGGSTYTDSQDIKGKLVDLIPQTVNFITRNLRHVQGERSVNSIGEPEIPQSAIEELVVNALVHRDYFISDPIKVFVFLDRVEIISPGVLPNNLTVENIKNGVSNRRNSILTSFDPPQYRGHGSGIKRVLKTHPRTYFINDIEGNRFIAILYRASYEE